MDTITIIVDTVFELVKAVLSPLGGLGDFLDGISTALKGSSELSSAEVDTTIPEPTTPVETPEDTPEV